MNDYDYDDGLEDDGPTVEEMHERIDQIELERGWLNTSEVAGLLDSSTSFILKMVHAGTFGVGATRKIAGQWYISTSGVRHALELPSWP